MLTKIACVEDDTDIAEILKFVLVEIGGFETYVFSSGRDFIKEIKSIKPQLILLDVMLPEKDGIQILKELKDNDQTYNIPVMFVTAKIQPEEIRYYRELGVGLIEKPFNPLEILYIINQYYENSQK